MPIFVKCLVTIVNKVTRNLRLKCLAFSKIFRISNYGTASTDSAAYILGGWIGKRYDDWRTSTIAQFQNNEWKKMDT